MGLLQDILDDADDDGSASALALAGAGMRLIRAPTSAVYGVRLLAASGTAGTLAKARVRNVLDGLETVEARRAGIHGGYWYLRSRSDLGEPFPAGRDRFPGLGEALRYAVVWWQAAPYSRSVVVDKAEIVRAEAAPRAVPARAEDARRAAQAA